MTTLKPFTVRAPGRVCIFGEHSDYLGLDVIPAAINLTITMRVVPTKSEQITVRYLDLNKEDTFQTDERVEYKDHRDYVRAAFNAMRAIGGTPTTGAEIEVTGTIPLRAGLSSSSALTVAAVLTAAHLGKKNIERRTVVNLAYQAEVEEFQERGGNQDHIASVYGGLIHLNSELQKVTPLPAKIEGLIIGDSKEQKSDTVGDLKRIRSIVEEGYAALRESIPGFNPQTTSIRTVLEHAESISDRCRKMTIATLQNRDLTARAYALMRSPTPSPESIGALIDEHHTILRDGLERSTPKIERLIEAAKQAGALGCKINGSGGGGSMLAYAPGKETAVMDAIKEAEGAPLPVAIGRGATLIE
ncbi:MAG: GHMP kinase [Candidatus Thorarchaeota archaeon]|nr:GHMP kinase [Candidatus Thorarchaeota archaeon]